MNAKVRDAVFQLCGGAAGLLVAAAPIYAAKAAFGAPGKFAIVVSVPFGVIIGIITVKLLHFAYRILVAEN